MGNNDTYTVLRDVQNCILVRIYKKFQSHTCRMHVFAVGPLLILIGLCSFEVLKSVTLFAPLVASYKVGIYKVLIRHIIHTCCCTIIYLLIKGYSNSHTAVYT